MPTAATTEARDAAIRDVKRYIQEIVRSDWTFESGITLPCSPTLSTESAREVVQWRLRGYDSSGSEPDQVSDSERHLENHSAIDETGELESEPQTAADRQRKRRKQTEEEMSWNNGLRTWTERRDAWTGARTRRSMLSVDEGKKEKVKGSAVQEDATTGAVASRPVGRGSENEEQASESSPAATAPCSSPGDPKEEIEVIAARAEAALTIADGERTEAQRGTEQSPQGKECDSPIGDAEEMHKESLGTIIPERERSQTLSHPLFECGSMDRSDLDEPLIPIVPSLISDTNLIRASITQSMYPSIYSKVVIQGLAPTVPINLADVIRATVQGWKADGQWPPKSGNTTIILPSCTVVSRPPAEQSAGGSTEPKRRRSSGVASAMRKVFHLSGHAFHRRGSSNGHQDAAAAAVTNAEK